MESSLIASLLGPGDPPPFEFFNATSRPAVLIVCDHAGAAVPHRLLHMGLDPARFREHIAVDLGARQVARLLSEDLGAAHISAAYSRLVVDLNRGIRDASLMPCISDGILIPENLGLAAPQVEERLAAIFRPYHIAIDHFVSERLRFGVAPVLIAVHSFTPAVSRLARPWHAGVLWDKDPRIAVPLLAGLRDSGAWLIGDNEPYSGRHPADYTLDFHAERNGLAHVAIEIRQDLITTAVGQSDWAELLAGILRPILDDESIFRRLGDPAGER